MGGGVEREPPGELTTDRMEYQSAPSERWQMMKPATNWLEQSRGRPVEPRAGRRKPRRRVWLSALAWIWRGCGQTHAEATQWCAILYNLRVSHHRRLQRNKEMNKTKKKTGFGRKDVLCSFGPTLAALSCYQWAQLAGHKKKGVINRRFSQSPSNFFE